MSNDLTLNPANKNQLDVTGTEDELDVVTGLNHLAVFSKFITAASEATDMSKPSLMFPTSTGLPNYLMPGWSIPSSTQGNAQTATRVLTSAIYCEQAMSVDSVSVDVWTADAGKVVRVALYQNVGLDDTDSFKPGVRVSDFGTASVGTTGLKTYSALSLSLTAQTWYWVVWGFDSSLAKLETGSGTFTPQTPFGNFNDVAGSNIPRVGLEYGGHADWISDGMPADLTNETIPNNIMITYTDVPVFYFKVV